MNLGQAHLKISAYVTLSLSEGEENGGRCKVGDISYPFWSLAIFSACFSCLS